MRDNNIDNKDDKLFSMAQMKWVYLVGTIVVIGGVMSYGFICYFVFDFDEDNSLSMTFMIPLMLLVYYFVIKIIKSGMEKKLRRLIDGIHEVASGNLDYRIDLKGAEEYTKVFSEFNDMVLELSKTKGEMESFVNEFAHEFKTPITAISGFAELLYETGDGVEDEERMQYLSLIKEESDRLCTLSKDTLLLSKVNAMQILENRVEYDVFEQIRRCVILLEKEFDNKRLNVEMDEDTILKIKGNPELMEHVWINLLTNAIKHSPGSSTIYIRSGAEAIKVLGLEGYDSSSVITITDCGHGMDEETLEHIFDKYYQKDKFSPGNGIGLSIVKRIVELNKGEVKVKSKLNEGTTFAVIM